MPHKVLLLEDEPALHTLYRRVLEMNGYEVHSARTLAEAHEALDRDRFDVFLADLRLPDGDASHLLLERREQLRQAGTQVVVLTAEARYRDMLEAAGYEFYFEKPISLNMLTAFLERLLTSQEHDASENPKGPSQK